MPCILRAPAARGLVAVGLTGGSVLLVDPRAKLAAEHSIAAHSAGLADVDVRGDMLATCGYSTRQGQVISDSYVKVGTGMSPNILSVAHTSAKSYTFHVEHMGAMAPARGRSCWFLWQGGRSHAVRSAKGNLLSTVSGLAVQCFQATLLRYLS